MRTALLIVALLGGLVHAQPLGFSPLCSTGAVLQQADDVTLWGTAAANQAVIIQPSWLDKPITTTADGEGRWSVIARTPEASGPHEITASLDTGEQIIARDILIGEVWLCSGQSNMEMPLAPTQWTPRGTEGWEAALDDADDANLRLFTVARRISATPLTNYDGAWRHADRESAASFSAAAYHMGRRLRDELDVPVGIVASSWGGTRVQAWMSDGAARFLPEMQQELEALDEIYRTAGGIEAELERRHRAWLDALAEADPGSGREGWWKDDLDTGDWLRCAVPGGIDDVAPGFDGVVWYRRTFQAPDELVGTPLTLRLGAIDDMDRVWINEQHVAGLEGFGHWATPREYTIPAGVVRSGANTIAIRVVDLAGPGGIGGVDGQIRLGATNADQSALRLDGEWAYRLGEHFEKLPPYPQGLSQHTASSLYNAMIAPLTPMNVRGFAWYQGESNRGDWQKYAACLGAMIDDWRLRFANADDAPFLIVQIAPFDYNGHDDATMRLREAQRHVAEANGNALVVTTDIGEAHDIHPIEKQLVGDRLAGLALAMAYGRDVCASPPRPTGAYKSGDTVTVTFDDTCGGLTASDEKPIRGFTVILADGTSRAVEATLVGGAVQLTALDAVAVRYAWSEVPDVNLANAGGIPASPFEIAIKP